MADAENIQPETLKQWLEKDEALVIDVREPDEYRFGHIEGAVNIPLATANPDTLPRDTRRKTVIQCGSGMRSQQACGRLQSGGKLYNLEGGLQAWQRAGFDIVNPPKAVLPVQRQVQIVVGILVLTGSALGYFINPAFLLIPAFVGAGLLNAGLSGWCGMAKLLTIMPWNKNP